VLARKVSKPAWKSAAAKRLFQLAPTATTAPEAVKVIVARLLNSVSCPPTNLEQLARQLNVHAILFEDLPISGQLRRKGKTFEIVCSSWVSGGRRQFTIAHEIGHAIFESTGPRCPQTGTELERLCDMLATEILMPEEHFLRAIGSEISIRSIRQASRLFRTSLSATAIRCAELRRISVFEADEERILWSYGVVKRGSIANLDSALQPIIESAHSGNSGQEEIYMTLNSSVRKWRVEYAPLARGRSFFLLQSIPMSQSSSLDLMMERAAPVQET
jgi:hypothetical protein